MLRAPPGRSVRPTSDRVREAVFDILGSLTELRGLVVADLFAGSGAMGIEALSRGAGSVVFVDNDHAAARAVRANLAAAGMQDAPSAVVRTDVLRWLSGPRHRGEDRYVSRVAGCRTAAGPPSGPGPEDGARSGGGRRIPRTGPGAPGDLAAGPPPGGFDLVLADPPYAFAEWGRLLSLLDARLCVLESDRDLEVPERFEVMRRRRYGGTLVTVICERGGIAGKSG